MPFFVSQVLKAAYILEDNLERRKELVKIIKAIFQKRSAIVHGGDKQVSDDVLHSALKIGTALVDKLIGV
jgi:hypothetical protein